MQVDAAVGQILASLESNGLADDTLVIFTSDNGCSPVAKYPELLAKGHDPSAGYRGTKADIFEGGHRVPFIVRWPGKVKPGTVSDQVICLTDLFSTCAEILGTSLPDTAAEDSVSFLPALLGTAARRSVRRSCTIRSMVPSRSGKGPGSWSCALTQEGGALRSQEVTKRKGCRPFNFTTFRRIQPSDTTSRQSILKLSCV